MTKDSPTDFLSAATKDARLTKRVHAAVERGNRVTAEEVLQIAEEFGYSFTRAEFERAVLGDMRKRFEAGDDTLNAVFAKKPKPTPKPPMSSCAKGCVSWTVNWCPDPTLLS